MQLSEIEAFLAVVKSGSLSGAAEQLYITQPAL
ncbi:MAG: LysR family transcriptional regulator, partial [Clostridiales bacterium]|nr:LysR family transcriptional regulator [Clostridiales bacterium]